MQTSLRGIANKAAQDRAHRFQNLYGLLTAGFLLWCWHSVNKKSAAGVDRVSAHEYEENLIGNIESLARIIQEGGRISFNQLL